jgi:putative ABC transport system substrate-binding protein
LALILVATASAHAAPTVIAIKSKDIRAYDEALDGFRQTCAATIAEYTLQDGELSEQEILSDVAKSRPTLIHAIGSPALRFAADNFEGIPIVFSLVVDPAPVVGERKRLAGSTLKIPPGDQFEALLRIAPQVKRIGVVYDPSKTGQMVKEAVEDVRRLGLKLELVSRPVASSQDVPAAWQEIQGDIDAIWMVPDTTAVTDKSFQYMLSICSKRNLPLLAVSGKYVGKGALLALTTDYRDSGKQAGALANRVLNGENIDAVRYETAGSPKLTLNLGTARLIGLNVPKEVVDKAAQVYR